VFRKLLWPVLVSLEFGMGPTCAIAVDDLRAFWRSNPDCFWLGLTPLACTQFWSLTMRASSRPRTDSVRVIVADATLMACGLVSARLKRHPQLEVVGYAASVDDLMRLMEQATPDVALISAALQDGPFSGLAIVPEICSKYPGPRVVLMVDRSDPELVVQAFRAGARGVFSRAKSRPDLLCKCVICVHRGQIWADSQQPGFLVDAVVRMPSVRMVKPDRAPLLTKREEDLLRLVADGLANREIAQQLNLSEHTVKNYMFRIFDKLGVSNRVELVLYALSSSKRSDVDSR
jgi:DNA-binding NarL/FixJ family response regulator